MNQFNQENELVKERFNLEDVLTFQSKHDIQIIRGNDYMYMCYIDKAVYATGLTPMHVLTIGIENYNNLKNND